MRELICITCPRGCHLEVDETTGAVTGNGCPRGAEYGKNEVLHPVRTVTGTVAITGAELPRLPVRTDRPIPKGQVRALGGLLLELTVSAPVVRGQVLVKNIMGTGADLVATRSLECVTESEEGTCLMETQDKIAELEQQMLQDNVEELQREREKWMKLREERRKPHEGRTEPRQARPEQHSVQAADQRVRTRANGERYDAVEDTPQFRQAVEAVEAQMGDAVYPGSCHLYWSLLKDELAMMGIEWRSPAELNPGTRYD